MQYYGARKVKSDLGRRSTLIVYISKIKGLNETNNGSAIKNIREIESGAKKTKKFF